MFILLEKILEVERFIYLIIISAQRGGGELNDTAGPKSDESRERG